MQYKISVCVPIYNVEKYFEQCLTSLFTQTMLDGVEFIFVNDCTPDDSMEILQRMLKKYITVQSHVRIFVHEQNRGLAAARNTAIENAQGEYIIHVDSDDWVESDYLEKLYKTITENNADIAMCNFFLHHKNGLKENGVQQFPDYGITDNISYIHLAFRNQITCTLWAKLVHRDLYRKHKIRWVEGINKGEDVITSLKLFCNANKIVYIEEPLYNYRLMIGFTMKEKKKKLIEQDILGCHEIDRFFKENGYFQLFKNEVNARKAIVRYEYLIHQKWYDVNKYSECFPDVKLRNIELFQPNPSIIRKLLYFSVDQRLYVIANLYFLTLQLLRKSS